MDFSEHYPDSSTPVALACRSGDIETLRILISNGKSVESKDNRGWRPIHEAACWDHADCIAYLIENAGAQLNSYTFEGQTPLWIAAYHNCLKAAQALLQAGAGVNLPNNEDVTPLHCAASKGFSEMAALLLENGANPNLPDYGFYTPLHEAAIEGHESIVCLLLEKGAHKLAQDSHGRTPLFCGAQAHKCAVLRLLGDKSSSTYVDMRAHDGATALMLTAQSGCLDCVKYLFEKGADPNAKANDGVMAVHLALTSNQKNVLEYLLDVTDHQIIAKCCNPTFDLAVSDGFLENRWNENTQESVNIFSLAISYERLDLIPVLLSKGLRPDEFPCLWKYRNRPMLTVMELDFPFATPLSCILSYSPFNSLSLNAVKSLVGKGSTAKSCGFKFVPPVFALLFAQGWEHADEENVLRDALYFLTQETDAIECEQLSLLMAASLCKVPQIFTHILHLGYLFDEVAFFDVFKRLSNESNHYSIALAALRSAGFGCTVIPEILKADERNVRSLKQLSRSAVRLHFWKSNLKTPIPKAALPLPVTLVSYLCYNDIEL